MTARQGSWDLVGHSEDPVPASEYDVDGVAREMSTRADAAREVKDVLKSLAALDGWRGKAAEAFGSKAEGVLDNLGKVVDRYDAVSEALSSWGDDVGEARTATWAALQDAEAADQSVSANEHTTPIPGEELTSEEDSANSRHDSAKGDLQAAKGAMQTAMSNLDDAAERAKNKIEDAADIWDDGRFAGFKSWVRDHAELIDAIVKVLEVIAVVLAAVVLVAIVFFTAPFWLIALAVSVSALILVGVFMLAVSDTGKRDWGDVGMATVGLVLTFAGGGIAKLASRGLARLVPMVSSRVGAQAASATRAAWAQRLSSWPAFQGASRITNPANNLARWVTGVRGNMSTAVQASDDAGRAGVEALQHLSPARLSRLLTQDAGLAQARTTLQALNRMGLEGAETALAGNLNRLINTGITVNLTNLGLSIPGVSDTVSAGVEGVTNFVTDPPWSARP